MIRGGPRTLALLSLLGDLLAIICAFHRAVRLRVAFNPYFRPQMDLDLLQDLALPRTDSTENKPRDRAAWVIHDG